jgi:hypothetical protein
VLNVQLESHERLQERDRLLDAVRVRSYRKHGRKVLERTRGRGNTYSKSSPLSILCQFLCTGSSFCTRMMTRSPDITPGA